MIAVNVGLRSLPEGGLRQLLSYGQHGSTFMTTAEAAI